MLSELIDQADVFLRERIVFYDKFLLLLERTIGYSMDSTDHHGLFK